MLESKKLRKAGGSPGKNTIPVIVDNIINLPSYNMVRFVYFSIDATDNPKSYRLKTGKYSIPVWIISFQGIIHAPVTEKVFSRPASIERLFNAIEKNGDFFVDTNDLWLPVSLFQENPKRGEVYRITRDLFSKAIKFRNDRIEYNEFIQVADSLNNQLYYSGKETKAFKAWGQLKIREAKKIYPKDKELKLRYVES